MFFLNIPFVFNIWNYFYLKYAFLFVSLAERNAQNAPNVFSSLQIVQFE